MSHRAADTSDSLQGTQTNPATSELPPPPGPPQEKHPDLTESIEKRVWAMPYPYGTGAAVESMSGVAAPLLAGFSITLLGVVAQAPASFRWPGATLIALLIAAALLIVCVQMGFRARQFIYSRADFEQWRPQPVEGQEIEDYLRDTQKSHFEKWQSHQRIGRITYNGAIVTLAAALSLVIAPPDSSTALTISMNEQGIRWAGSALAAASALGELVWILRDQIRVHVNKTRLKGANDV